MMRDQLADIIADYLLCPGGVVAPPDTKASAEDCFEAADAIIAALPGMVKPVVFVESDIAPWDGDYHSLPTEYKIRGMGNEKYLLSYPGGFSHHNSAEAAKNAANARNAARIMRALGVTEGE